MKNRFAIGVRFGFLYALKLRIGCFAGIRIRRQRDRYEGLIPNRTSQGQPHSLHELDTLSIRA